jgi:uncharacterized circularly permuted ATP-grasp superfamily protein/uncharacterized alpha-E superfamily protein
MTDTTLSRYKAVQHGYDEVFAKDGEPRAHWRKLLDHLGRETADDMRHRVDAVERRVFQNGVTYNVYADPKGTQRAWQLDVLPFILPASEWSEIEAAVRQRATLLNKILIDLYGPQQVLADGLLPPALVHGHSSFLRPCHGITHVDDIALHLIAVDLARSPDGRWWVVSDRTQAPSGAGYALENRNVIAQAFPDLLRELKVRPIHGFFDALRDSLMHWGRHCADRNDGKLIASEDRNDAPPLIVLLTPGQFNETYYEQTYLARHLGFPLVEGGDLTVRNGIVWLKTLSGPQRVHVILRRVDDDFCDPLELRSDSALGVAGLTDSARRGNVIVANGLGSNLLETGALLGYLPALCRNLLGESLRMPSVATWWCGEPAALEAVIEDLDGLIIKSAFPQLRQEPIFGGDLDSAARKVLIQRMRAQPHFFAQETVRFSHAPVWRGARNAPQHTGLDAATVGLRVFACATPKGYVVMPGAMTRVAAGPDTRVITMQRGGSSKDTWVQSTGRTQQLDLQFTHTTARELVRGDTHLSSRMVDNLFWLGRTTERCDNRARLLRTALDFLLNTSAEFRGGEWSTLQALCQWFGLLSDTDEVTGELSDAEIELELLKAVVATEGDGLAANLQQLYRIASHLRERLSLDNWRILNQILQQNNGIAQLPTLADAVALLDRTAGALMTLSGFALDGMTRDNGWRFMSIGRRLERLQFLCTVLQHGMGMPAHSSLEWILQLTDSIVTYRSRYMAQPEWHPLLDLLVMDDSNPRSVRFQLIGLVKFLDRLAQSHGTCGGERMRELLDELQALDIDRDLQCGSIALTSLLTKLSNATVALSDQLGLQFFSQTGKVNRNSFTRA